MAEHDRETPAQATQYAEYEDYEREPRVVQSGPMPSYFYELFDHAPVGYLVLAEDGVLVEANHTAAELMGAPKPHLIGQRLDNFVSARSSEDLRVHLQEVTSTDARRACIVDIEGAKAAFQAHLDSIAARDEDGTVVEVRTILSRRLLERDSHFRAIADHIEDVLYVREADGRFSYVSRACEQLWGRPAPELTTREGIWNDSIHPDDCKHVLESHRRFVQGDPFDEEYRIHRADGTQRWVRDRAFHHAGDDGSSTRVIGILQDITDTRALETELWQAQKMEAVGTLASGIAHDFRNLLQAILGCATAALRAENASASRSYWTRVLDAVRRGADLVGHLMTFSRKEPVRPCATLIDSAIQASAKLLAPLVGDHIKLLIGAGAPAAVVVADPIQIEQVLMNLSANARDAMPEGGTLSIWSETVAPLPNGATQVRVFVRDTGCGMAAETRDQIFEPFFTTKQAGAGTGLGLATVLGIVKSMRGEIRVDSELGTGTTFVITLPCATRRPVKATPIEAVIGMEGRVLLVEDEPLVRMTLRKFLEDLGLDVRDAADAREALEVSSAMDLLISDVSMPGMMGPQLAVHLRKRWPALKCLFISAEPRDQLLALGILDEGAAFLGKPFTLEELGAAITNTLCS